MEATPSFDKREITTSAPSFDKREVTPSISSIEREKIQSKSVEKSLVFKSSKNMKSTLHGIAQNKTQPFTEMYTPCFDFEADTEPVHKTQNDLKHKSSQKDLPNLKYLGQTKESDYTEDKSRTKFIDIERSEQVKISLKKFPKK